MLLREEIPDALVPAAEAATQWINEAQGSSYDLTGLAASPADPTIDGSIEMGIVLCDGDICARKQVLVQPHAYGFNVAPVALSEAEIPALLDPPVGVRSQWLEAQLERCEFVLLLFYRGRW